MSKTREASRSPAWEEICIVEKKGLILVIKCISQEGSEPRKDHLPAGPILGRLNFMVGVLG